MSGSLSFGSMFNLANLTAPASGVTHSAKFTVTFSGGGTVTLPMTGYVQQLGGDYVVQAMQVDNTANTTAITITEIRYGWTITIAAGQNKTFQVIGVQQQQFNIVATAATAGPIVLSMFDWPAFPDSSFASGAGGTPVVVVGNVAVTQATTPWVTQSNPATLTGTGRGGTITAGGTAQVLAAANAARKSLVIVNPATAATQGIAATENLLIQVGGTAATLTGDNYAEIVPGGSLTLLQNDVGVDQTAVSVIAATTGHRWYAREFQ